MTTVLASNLYVAARNAKKQSEPVKTLPVSTHLLIGTRDGRMFVTPFCWQERTEKTQFVPARVDDDFETCVPARAFVDWLSVTRVKQPKKITRRNGYKQTEWVNDQIILTLDPQCQILHIQAGNTRAEFKCIDAEEFPPTSAPVRTTEPAEEK